jgi:hypothetical protein
VTLTDNQLIKANGPDFDLARFLRTTGLEHFYLNQGLQNRTPADSFHVLLKNLCQ